MTAREEKFVDVVSLAARQLLKGHIHYYQKMGKRLQEAVAEFCNNTVSEAVLGGDATGTYRVLKARGDIDMKDGSEEKEQLERESDKPEWERQPR